jgi:hypothetical protein
MKIDVENYSVQREPVRRFLASHPDLPIADCVKRLTAMTGCPIIVVCLFISEVRGSSEELDRKIKDIKEFYGYG